MKTFHFCTKLEYFYLRWSWNFFLHFMIGIVPVRTLLPSDWKTISYTHFVELTSMLISWGTRWNYWIFCEIWSFTEPYSTFTTRQGRVRFWVLIEGFFTPEWKGNYYGLGGWNLLERGKAWVSLAGELLARCFRTA